MFLCGRPLLLALQLFCCLVFYPFCHLVFLYQLCFLVLNYLFCYYYVFLCLFCCLLLCPPYCLIFLCPLYCLFLCPFCGLLLCPLHLLFLCPLCHLLLYLDHYFFLCLLCHLVLGLVQFYLVLHFQLLKFKQALSNEPLGCRLTSFSLPDHLFLFFILGSLSKKNNCKRFFGIAFTNSRLLAANHTTQEIDLSFEKYKCLALVKLNRLWQLELLDCKLICLIKVIFLDIALFGDPLFALC